MKDLGDLHLAALESGQPEMFKKSVESIVWRACLRQKQRREQTSTTSTPVVSVDVVDVSTWGAVRFTDMGAPVPPQYLVQNVVQVAQPTYIYGGRGTLKSINALAIAIGIASPEVAGVLGFQVEEHGPVIVFDSELNADVFNSRATAICRGLGISKPVNLIYRNVVGVPPNESFPVLHDLAERVRAVAVVIDSFGFATRGDPESYKDTRNNTTEYLDPLIAKGIAPIIVEHKPHQGNHIFGSVAKEYHGRFIFRVEDLDGDDRVKGERNTRLINEKASFTDEGQKISLLTRFSAGKIVIENLGVPDEDEDDSGSNADVEVKVRRVLEKRNMPKDELAAEAAVSIKYLGNILPRMVRDGIIHIVGSGVPYVYGVEPPGPEGSPTTNPDGDTSTTSTIHRDVDVVDVLETRVADTALAVTEPDELLRIVGAINSSATVALDLETMPPAGWIWKVVADYRKWRKGIKNKPKRERMHAQWDKFKQTVYKKYAVNPETAEVRLLSLATNQGLNETVDATRVDLAPVLDALKHKTVIAHNGSFDLGVLRERYGYVHDGRILDTGLLYILYHYAEDGKRSVIRDGKWRLPDPTKTKVQVGDKKVGMTALKVLVKKYLPDVDLDKSSQAEDWSVPNLSAEMVTYSLKDSKVLLELAKVLMARLESIGMANIVEDIESRAMPAKIWMERNGIPASKTIAEEMRVRYSEEAGKALEKLTAPLEGDTAPDGRTWSWTKDEHVRAALTEIGADLKELDKTGKTGVPSTGKDSLNKITSPPAAVEWVEAYLQYQNLRKRSSDFINKYAELVRENGTIPGRFDTVSTGRFNCTKPNLQQVPKRGELQTIEGMRIRDIFRARPGKSLVIADFEQVELLLAATIAERRSGTTSKMLDVFRAKDSDIHRATAAWVLGKPEEDITKSERSLAKAINFGLIYGCSAEKLLEVAVNDYGIKGMTLKDAKKYRTAFFEKYPEFVAWHNKVSKECKNGREYSTTPRGRRRKLPRWDKSGDVAFTTAVNHPVQGAGADAIKLTLAKLFEDRHNCPGNPELNCTVHDEVILSVEAEHAETAKAWVEKHMADAEREAVMDLKSPIAVDVKAKESWGG